MDIDQSDSHSHKNQYEKSLKENAIALLQAIRAREDIDNQAAPSSAVQDSCIMPVKNEVMWLFKDQQGLRRKPAQLFRDTPNKRKDRK